MKKDVSLKKSDKNPAGGLSASGRKRINAVTGSNLKPGVTKPESEMSPNEMIRKGSFLRRHYAGPAKPLKDDKGQPTRHALQARAWGEPVPASQDKVRALASKGSRLLEKGRKKKE